MIQRLLLLALFAMTVPALASADSVYRWTDENGVVHFGDREPSGRSSERVSVKTGKPSGDGERQSPRNRSKPWTKTRPNGNAVRMKPLSRKPVASNGKPDVRRPRPILRLSIAMHAFGLRTMTGNVT